MRIPYVLLSTALLGACASSGSTADQVVNENLVASRFPDLPADARAVAERLADCLHLAGEIGGDRSERDREVYDSMSRLRCEAIEKDVADIRRKYEGDKAVEQSLSAASDL